MLKIIIPLSTLLLLSPTSKNLWTLCISICFILTTITLTLVPSQILTPSILSNLTIIDSLNSPLVSLSIWITALILIARYKETINKNKPKSFIIYTIILTIILLITFISHNIVIFYIFFEASLIPTILLILGWGYQPERLQARIYLTLYTVAASLPLLIRLILIYHSPTNLSITLSHWETIAISQKVSTIWWIITILAFLTKIPLYMLHLWLPKAHVEAPVAGSIILARILLKLGRYGLIRLSSIIIKLNILISPLIISLSLWGAVLTRIICLRQTDLKSLIAYSSIGHISLLIAGLLSNSSWGWNASLTIILAHGLCSSRLFSLANITYESTQTRRIFLTKGIITIFPTITIWWFLNCAMNMAAPPTSNLLRELFLIIGTISYSLWTTLTLILIVFIGAAYSLHLYASSQHGPTSPFSLPINLFTQRNYTTIILHLMPATALILKSDTIITWL